MKRVTVSKHLKAGYDNYYQQEDPEWRRLGAIGKAANILSLCSHLPHASVLEIGAGEGSVLQRLSDLGFGDELHALEISSSGVEAIRARAIPRLVQCDVFDGYHLPCDDARFDLAILSHVIEHVEHPRQLLYEASRAARYLFVEVPLEHTLRLARDFVFDGVGHINVYTPKTIRHLVQSCGLHVIRQIVTNPGKQTYSYRQGRRGLLKYHVKELLLRSLGGAATILFTYHGALVCESSTESRRGNSRSGC